MTIGINEKPSPLSDLLVKETQGQSNAQPAGQPDRNFSGKLDSILAANVQNPQSAQATAQSLAESFKLQMLHSSLALAGDHAADAEFSSLVNRQSAEIQSLI